MNKIKIEISKENKMIYEEWGIFLFGSAIVLLMFFTMVNLIKTFEEGQQLLALLVFMFVLLKAIWWIRIPTTYTTNDVMEELDYYFKRDNSKDVLLGQGEQDG